MVKVGGRVVVAQELVGEGEMVVVTAMAGWMVVRPMLVGGRAAAVGRMEVMEVELEMEMGGGSVTVTLLQDLQHMRCKSGREQ